MPQSSIALLESFTGEVPIMYKNDIAVLDGVFAEFARVGLYGGEAARFLDGCIEQLARLE